MIWHPLTWAFWVAAATGGLLYGAGAVRAMDVALNWTPARSDSKQLARERHAETAALLGRWALGSLTAAAMLGLGGIAVVWHRTVPGAMCGTGVLQATGTDGSRAMIFWAATVSVLYAWRAIDHLDGHHPEGVLTQTAARVMVTAVPFLTLAVFYSWQALMRVENVPSVSCCAAVYDQVLKGASGSGAGKQPVSVFLWGSLTASTALLLLAALKIRFPDRGPGGLPAVISILWGAGAAAAVKHVWSAYYYQVLSHPCPWCLFLPDYYGAGFFIFGCMAMVVMESIALWLADLTRRRYPVLAHAAGRRIRRAARRMVLALIGFTILTAGPAIAWHIRTGVWLDGSF